MNLVDLIVVVVVALAAIQGLRLGAIVQVLSFGGFWIGLYLGAMLASVTVRQVHAQSARTSVALVTMLGVAVLCGVVGRIAGNLAFQRVHRGIAGSVDSGLGVVVAVVASLLAAWLLANTLVNSSSLEPQRLDRPVEDHPLPRLSASRPALGVLAGPGLPLRRRVPTGVRPTGAGVSRPGVASRRRPAPTGSDPRRGVDGQDRRRRGAGRSKRDRVSSSLPASWSPTPMWSPGSPIPWSRTVPVFRTRPSSCSSTLPTTSPSCG